LSDPRYPVGEFRLDAPITPARRAAWLDEIAAAPARLREAVCGLDDAKLDTPYRDGGWTVRQVVHHVPDSHLNAYVRFRLALTEDAPIIRPYLEARWAELPDARSGPVEMSLALLETLHVRWVELLRAMTEADFRREFRHPEQGTKTLEVAAAKYAWHGRHHVAHVTALRARRNW
jgi:hypothetical protein